MPDLAADDLIVLAQFRHGTPTPAMYAAAMLNPLPPWPRRLLLFFAPHPWHARIDATGDVVERLTADGLLRLVESRRRLMSTYTITDAGRDTLTTVEKKTPGGFR